MDKGKVYGDKRNIVKELHAYCDEKRFGKCNLYGSSLGVNDIRGQIEIVYEQSLQEKQ